MTTLAYDMTSFRVQTEVSASPTFFGWVFGFNGKVQILAPELSLIHISVIDKVMALLYYDSVS